MLFLSIFDSLHISCVISECRVPYLSIEPGGIQFGVRTHSSNPIVPSDIGLLQQNKLCQFKYGLAGILWVSLFFLEGFPEYFGLWRLVILVLVLSKSVNVTVPSCCCVF
jgi:hypothetical protein